MMKTSLTAGSSVYHDTPVPFVPETILPYRIAAVRRRFFLDAKALL
jgi:hypothetical protein